MSQANAPEPAGTSADGHTNREEPGGVTRGKTPRPQGIVRNITWLGAGSAAVSPLWFFFISYLCIRILPPEAYGVMNWALWLMTIAASATDLGLNDFVTREVARERNQAWRYFSNFVVFRVGFGLLVIVAVIGVAALVGVSEVRIYALLLAGIYALSVYILSFCRVFFRAFEVLRYESISLMLEKLLVLSGGTAFLLATRTATGTLTGMTIGMLIALVGTVCFVIYRIAPFETGVVTRQFLGSNLRRAAPLGVFAVSVIVFWRIGPVILDFFEGAAAVGRYGAAYRIIEAMLLLPALATAALLPRLSPTWSSGNRDAFRSLVHKALLAMAVVSGFLGLCLAIGGGALMDWIVSDPEAYAGSGTILRILGVIYPAMCLNSLQAIVLIASDDQRFLGRFMALVTTATTLLLVIAIWQFQIPGLLAVFGLASVATSVALWRRFELVTREAAA